MMFIALIHWRIKPEEESKAAFIQHWNTRNSISNRKGLIAEFVSDTLPIADFPYITWHLDPESLGNFKSYVTIGLWADAENFQEQVAQYFNDDKPLLSFEKYRRRRVIFEPVGWRVGETPLPSGDSPGVQQGARSITGILYPVGSMNWVRDFGMQEAAQPARTVEDATREMRQELIDLFFGLAEQNVGGGLSDERLHRVVSQSLGIAPAGNPYGGYRYAAGRDIGGVPWQRIYDLISRLWPLFNAVHVSDQYLEGVNRILAGVLANRNYKNGSAG